LGLLLLQQMLALKAALLPPLPESLSETAAAFLGILAVVEFAFAVVAFGEMKVDSDDVCFWVFEVAGPIFPVVALKLLALGGGGRVEVLEEV
jgi:hypothetical protein